MTQRFKNADPDEVFTCHEEDCEATVEAQYQYCPSHKAEHEAQKARREARRAADEISRRLNAKSQYHYWMDRGHETQAAQFRWAIEEETDD
jgi:hypothetical protein